MRLATRSNGTPDGELLVISKDGARGVPAGERWPNLLAAIDHWNRAEADLRELADAVETGAGEAIDPDTLRAPLPRSWQWLDGSAFAAHGELMQIAFKTDPIVTDKPLMYQGMSDRFYGPYDPVPFRRQDDGIDFEGEFGVVVDAVPMGVTADAALAHVKLLVQINDWSLRALAVPEMKTGFGWIQAKPACSMAPFAATPDSLGNNWREGRIHLNLDIALNGARFGRANGREMHFGFHELIAHAAATRDLVAGTIIGSGTVANANYQEVGSSCLSERRAIEIIAHGRPSTEFMSFGDRVRMEAISSEGEAPFGVIDQMVTEAAT
ncbi:fumarylacetoacetate hydrolase family protein [Sphingomonas sp. AR_OL41]|uniref:fumarylacetoacetate hydrolase family protein n=1 Tax=Sphingomonas sp. AR_OL41 TaxID=3042729 RepID=UPI0024817949|nr:fumarylacetoacetate hydrolase family protein [Sphingomonas sp. AR_OL41]MDH7971918.1 fumarylacetoacetate hydrolase family protein [Sphingomonas sp. AR_OL41]